MAKKRALWIVTLLAAGIALCVGVYLLVILPRIDALFENIVPTYDTLTAELNTAGGVTVTLRRGQDYPHDIPTTLADLPARVEGSTITLLLPDRAEGTSACVERSGGSPFAPPDVVCEFYAVFPLGSLPPGDYPLRLEGAGMDRWASAANTLRVSESGVEIGYGSATAIPAQ